MKTRTGGYRIGFRAGNAEWQKDLSKLGAWGKASGFELIDLGQVGAAEVKAVKATGLDVVSVDLLSWPALLSDDAGKRRDAIQSNAARIAELSALGVKVYFAVIIPENPDIEARVNFDRAVAAYGEVAAAAEKAGAALVIEGWPGMWPRYGNLCCNPEQYRALLKAVPSRGLMINLDTSHLIRMGIDYLRFVDEFATRVGHVHGKDCEIISEAVYDVGLYQKSLFTEPHRFGEYAWRYTIPGHGVTRWSPILQRLQKAGFAGAISVELEDENYNGSESGEKAGLLASLSYLQTV